MNPELADKILTLTGAVPNLRKYRGYLLGLSDAAGNDRLRILESESRYKSPPRDWLGAAVRSTGVLATK